VITKKKLHFKPNVDLDFIGYAASSLGLEADIEQCERLFSHGNLLVQEQ
jgi:hypothetical protein